MIFEEVGGRRSETAIVHSFEDNVSTFVISNLNRDNHRSFHEKVNPLRKLLASCTFRKRGDDRSHMLPGDLRCFLNSLVRLRRRVDPGADHRISIEYFFQVEIVIYFAQCKLLLWLKGTKIARHQII